MHTIVVGGGLLGVATAYALGMRGEQVAVFESAPGLGLGASYANGALLTPSMPEPWNSPGSWKVMARSFFDRHSAMKLRLRAIPSMLSWGSRFLRTSTATHHSAATRASFALADYSLRHTRRLRERLGLRYEEASTGSMKLFRDAQSMERCVHAAEALTEGGLRYQKLNADETVTLEPALLPIRDAISGAIFYPDDECGNAYLFCRELAEHARKMGVQFATGTSVRRLLLARGKIRGVETGQGAVEAARVIVAAGSASPRLLAGLGVELPVQPVKGYSITLNVPSEVPQPRIPVVDDAMHAAVVPVGRCLRVVGTAEFAGFDTRIRTDRIDNLLRLFAAIYPDLARAFDRNGARYWAGLRPMSADGLPFVGETVIPGLFLNTGHGHLGWTMAVGSAHLLAGEITGEPLEIDGHPYRPTR